MPKPRPRPRSRPEKSPGRSRRLSRAVRREQILDAALRVYDRRYPGDVTYDQIAEEAGVSRPLVYVYFRDREALAVGIVERAVSALRGAFADATDNPRTLSAIEATRIIVRFARDNPAAFRQLAGLATHANRPLVQKLHDRLLARAVELLGGDSEARLLAHGIAGLLRGGASYWLNEQDVEFERACQMLAEMVDVVITRGREIKALRRAGPR